MCGGSFAIALGLDQQLRQKKLNKLEKSKSRSASKPASLERNNRGVSTKENHIH